MSDDFEVSESKGGGDHELPPTGLQPAMSVKLYSLGWQPGFQGKGPVQKIAYLFELQAKMAKGDFAGKRFRLTKTYTKGLGTKEKPSNLRKDLISWREGKEFTEEERAKFSLSRTLLKPCMLNLTEKVKRDGKKTVEISTILPAKQSCSHCGGSGKITDHACDFCKGKGKVASHAAWTPETPADYMPEWVKTALTKQVEPPEWAQPNSHAGEGAGAPDSDIPF